MGGDAHLLRGDPPLTQGSPSRRPGFEPAPYLALYRCGSFRERVEASLRLLDRCEVCPWGCGARRAEGESDICQTGRLARVSSAFPHHGEERCLSGWGGSGTIFFTHCNLHCVFCQNYDVSHLGAGAEVEAAQLARTMLELQLAGCHNINLVTPTHVVPQILEALEIAIGDGLRLPIVYNSSGFDEVRTLRLLDGIVDIYMPDFKLWSPEAAERYLARRDYPEVARAVLREMHRQVGDLELGVDGIARRGLLVRHLVMPGLPEETRSILSFLSEEISPSCHVNVMEQYRPAGQAGGPRYPEIGRRPRREEIDEAVGFARRIGLRVDSVPEG